MKPFTCSHFLINQIVFIKDTYKHDSVIEYKAVLLIRLSASRNIDDKEENSYMNIYVKIIIRYFKASLEIRLE